MREHAERRKEAQRQAQEEKNQKVKEWMDEEGADKPEIAHLYLAWSAITVCSPLSLCLLSLPPPSFSYPPSPPFLLFCFICTGRCTDV